MCCMLACLRATKQKQKQKATYQHLGNGRYLRNVRLGHEAILVGIVSFKDFLQEFHIAGIEHDVIVVG